MGTSDRRDRDRQEMRKLIVETATQILVEEGIDQVSIRRIADRIEYSPGTIYLYFEDKDDILYEAHLDASRSTSASSRIPTRSPSRSPA